MIIRSNIYKRNFGELTFDIFNVVFFIILSVIMIFPLWNVLMTSFVGAGEFFSRSLILWPDHFIFSAYKYLFGKNSEIFQAFKVTVELTIVGTAYSMIISTMLAYGLSKDFLPGQKFFIILIAITMFFRGGLIPNYLLIRKLGLMNKFFVLFIPSAVNTWNFIVIKSFFKQFPVELEESARIDGASDLKIFWVIVLPLSKAMLATFSLFYAVYYWNSWWSSTLYIQKSNLFTLQYVLRQMIVVNKQMAMMDAMSRQAGMKAETMFDEGIKMAAVIVATVPILALYPFLQKHFTKGMMIGSVKG